MSGSSPGVIVAAAAGYRYDQVAPFVENARTVGFDGPIVLILDRRIDNDDMARLRSANVTPHIVRNPSWFVRSNHVAARLSRGSLRSRPGRLIQHLIGPGRRLALQSPTNRRFHLLPIIRAAHPELFDGAAWVFHTDLRDVRFQSDPTPVFDELMTTGRLHVYAEGPADPADGEFRLCDGGSTLRWVTGLVGPTEAAQLADRPTICSGTILIDEDALPVLSARMIELLDRLTVGSSTFGFDQGALNVLLRTGALDDLDVVEHRNGEGGIATLAAIAPAAPWEFDGSTLRYAGSVPPIVHQFDRDTTLRRAWGDS